MPAVSVVGGSIGGLTAALVLRDAGCDVRVFERSPAALTAEAVGLILLAAGAFALSRSDLITAEPAVPPPAPEP